MSKARLVITALFVEGLTPAEVAHRYGIHRSTVYRLRDRYLAEGETAFEPRSRRPKTMPGATAPATVDLVLRLRKELTEAGLDAGADTIGWHLRHHHRLTLSRATIHRILARNAVLVPDPSKRPKSSYTRFEADQPNECWQSDFTHYRLPPASMSRSSPGSTTTPLRPAHQRSRPDHRGNRAQHLHQDRSPARVSGVHPDRQRHGLLRPVRRRSPRRSDHARGRAPRPRHRPEELQAEPPHHLRKGRTLPANPEELAARPARPTTHHRRSAGAP